MAKRVEGKGAQKEKGKEEVKKEGVKVGKLSIGLIILLAIFFLIVFSYISNLSTEKILVVPVKGVISSSDSGYLFFTEQATAPFITSCMDRALKDGTIKAVVLDIDSPGGGVVASARVAEKVEEVRGSKPVVAVIEELGASGAYWIASEADTIIANPFSLTGSIGVTASYLEYGGLLNMFNVSYERLVTGEYKDITTPYRELTPRERQIILEKLGLIHEEFVNVISENRDIPKEDAERIANGLFYLGKEARELGLVDELGDREDAEKRAREMANAENAVITECKHRGGFSDLFFGATVPLSYAVGEGIGNGFAKALSAQKFSINS
ncbi:MAG: signal peptide peptidase SppA [Nanoarchaeota archaeon]